jgi:hypothetical protein
MIEVESGKPMPYFTIASRDTARRLDVSLPISIARIPMLAMASPQRHTAHHPANGSRRI